MRTMVAALVVMTGVVAQADIRPPAGAVETAVFTGEVAKAVYEGLDVPTEMVEGLRTRATSGKIVRAADGLTQIYCTATSDMLKGQSWRCQVQKSTDGRPLPRIVIHPRLG